MTAEIPPLQPCKSSMIEEWAHDEERQILYVRFRQNRKLYAYQGVDEFDFDHLKHAESIGQAFNKFKMTRAGKEVL